MRRLLILALLLCAVPAQAQDTQVTYTCPDGWRVESTANGLAYRCVRPPSTLNNIFTATYVGLAFADIAQTSRCRGAGICSEANPLMAPLVDKPLLVGVAKGAATAWVLHRCRSHRVRSPRWYDCWGTAIILQGAVVAWNYHQLRGRQ